MRTAIQLSRGAHSGTRATATLHWLLPVLLLAWLFRCWVWMPTLILGESMLPTLVPGHLVAVNKMAYWHRTPQRRELVVIRTERELLVKRIIALPGEEVAVTNGSVYIAGRPLPEPFVAFADRSNIARGRIPPGCYLAAGDNRRDSVFLLVAAHRIVGRLKIIGFPAVERHRGEMLHARADQADQIAKSRPLAPEPPPVGTPHGDSVSGTTQERPP